MERTFQRGDVIRILDQNKAEIARGICRYPSRELSQIAGLHSEQIEPKLGYTNGAVIVHRDEMVLLDASKPNQ